MLSLEQLKQAIKSMFRSKQASYKMVFMLAFIDHLDRDTLRAPLQDVLNKFKQFYLDRKNNGLTIERSKIEINKVEDFTPGYLRTLVLDNPVKTLSSFIVKKGNKDDFEYFAFIDSFLAQIEGHNLSNVIGLIRDAANAELTQYYRNHVDIVGTVSIRDALFRMMSEYPQAKNEPFKEHPLGIFMRQIFPQELSKLPFIDTNQYKIQGSVGQGNWAKNPWLAILDKDETQTTQRGVYIVYLFSEDMESVYLTLAQGVTIPIQEKGRVEAVNYLRENSIKLREFLPLEGMKKDENIYLSNSGLGSNYQASTIAYYKYEKVSLPEDEVLINDLRSVMENYYEYMEGKRSNPMENFEDTKQSHKKNPDENVKETLVQIKQFIRNKGFTFSDTFIDNLYLSIKAKPFTILAGISGTGKTQLVKLFAEAIGANSENGQFELIPVRPDWSDPSDLLGYTDLQGEFRKGRLLQIIEQSLLPENRNKPYFICLDEMNLARVEHYFSDILSIIESREYRMDEEGYRYIHTEPLLKLENIYYPLPENIYIIGTVNMDETTYPFSKKVLDRANTIEFNDINLAQIITQSKIRSEVNSSTIVDNDFFLSEYIKISDLLLYDNYNQLIKRVVEKLVDANDILEKAHFQVGYRVRDEIIFYMVYNDRFQLISEEEALDFQVMQKLLPRIQGSSIRVKKVLLDLFNYFSTKSINDESLDFYEDMSDIANNSIKYTLTLKKIADMTRRFEEDGFTSFWSA